MNVNFSILAALFRAELRMVVRDKRVLITSIVLPLLVTPLMFLGSNWGLQKRQKELQHMKYRYAVMGSQADEVRTIVNLAKELQKRQKGPGPSSRGKGARLRDQNAAPETWAFQFDEVACTNALAALARGEVQLVLQGLDEREGNVSETKSDNAYQPTAAPAKAVAKAADDEHEPYVPGVLLVRMIYRADRDDSASALAQMQVGLHSARSARREELLNAHGFPVATRQVATIREVDLATARQVAGLALGRTIALALLLFILPSGAVVAIDSLAGEKERGTLETLLTTAVRRGDILAAKGMVIVVIALVITLIQTANLLVYAGLKLIPIPGSLAGAVTPGMAVLLFVLFLPMAALAASVLLLISGCARTYKEAQMYFLPVLLLGLLPAMAPFLPGISLRSILVLVPIANLALAAKEMLIGVFDWPLILLSWLVTAAAAWWVTSLGLRVLSAERLIIASGADAAEFKGGPALFERQVWVWFGVLWAVLLMVGNYMEKADLRLQIIVNLLVLLFGASCWMLKRYRLDPKVALALRAPRPWVWLGVIIAVPGGVLTAIGLFHLSSVVLPVSTKITESFNEAVFPRTIPILQLAFFLTVLPGIFEEIAFRGLLLHGLHKRLRPATLALVVGVAFGIFHVTLFRFVPTAFLGVLFVAVTLLTGSIFPAMLWHALSNAAGILTYKLQIPETELTPGCYLGGAGLLAIAFWIFWRNRSPYPGLKLR